MTESRHHNVTAELQSQGLEALSAAALYVPSDDPTSNASDYLVAPEHQSPLQPSTPLRRSIAFPFSPPTSSLSNNNINFILNPDPDKAITPPIDPALEIPYTPMGAPSIGSTSSPNGSHQIQTADVNENDCEVTFLLRHFSESPGHWCVRQRDEPKTKD